MAQPRDVYGDVKVPLWEALETKIDIDGWRDVPPVLRRDDFSSLIGLRVLGLPPDTEAHFSVEYSYVFTACGPWVELPYSLNVTREHVNLMSQHMGFNFSEAYRLHYLPGQTSSGTLIRTFFIELTGRVFFERDRAFLGLGDPPGDHSSPGMTQMRRLYFGSLITTNEAGRRQAIQLTRCNVSSTPVEAAITCHGEGSVNGCRVVKQRLSLTDKRRSSLTMFENLALQKWLHSLPDNLPGSRHKSSLASDFLSGHKFTTSAVWLQSDNETAHFQDLSKVAPAVFSKRLSLLLNTCYQALLIPNQDAAVHNFTVFGNASLPIADLDNFAVRKPANRSDPNQYLRFRSHATSVLMNAMIEGLPFIAAATTATVNVHTPIYICQFAWLAALLVAAAALFAAGTASLALQLRSTLAPDMLRYVASMTYDNAFFRVPPGGTALDGMARTKLLQDVCVRIGDVNGASDVGRVAFVAVDDSDTRKLECNRAYA